MSFLTLNWFKLGVLVLLALGISAISYNFFVLVPKEQEFKNCLISYGQNWEESLNRDLGLSKVDLCLRGYSFGKFRDTFKVISNRIVTEYKEKYANPEDFWIKEKMKKEIYEETRTALGF